MAQKKLWYNFANQSIIITIHFLFITFKFKGIPLFPSKKIRNHLLIVVLSTFYGQNMTNTSCFNVLMSDIVSNHETGLCWLTLPPTLSATICSASCYINKTFCLLEMQIWQWLELTIVVTWVRSWCKFVFIIKNSNICQNCNNLILYGEIELFYYFPFKQLSFTSFPFKQLSFTVFEAIFA